MKYTFIKVISFAVILFFVSLPTFTLANSAPLYQPDANGSIIPIEATPVFVKNENLQLVLYKVDKPASVIVQYVFMNPTEHPIETNVAFPYTTLSTASTPEIKVNGVSILTNNIKIHSEKNQLNGYLDKFQSATFLYIDPVTGKQRDRWNGYDIIKQSDSAVFKVNFAPLKETTVQIEYRQNFGVDGNRYINPVHLYEYILSSAVSWKEFHHLQIGVAVPRNHFFASNLTIKPDHGNRNDWLGLPKEVQKNPSNWVYFKGEFASLPQKNFAFSTISKDHLLFGMVEKKTYDIIGSLLLGFTATLSVIGMALLINLNQKWWMHWQLGPILSFIVSNSLTFLSYKIFTHFIPVASNGEWIGGSHSIFTILFFGFYITIIYFPVIFAIQLIGRRRRKNQVKAIEGEIGVNR